MAVSFFALMNSAYNLILTCI